MGNQSNVHGVVWQREQAEAATGAERSNSRNVLGKLAKLVAAAVAGTLVVLRFGQQLQYMFY